MIKVIRLNEDRLVYEGESVTRAICWYHADSDCMIETTETFNGCDCNDSYLVGVSVVIENRRIGDREKHSYYGSYLNYKECLTAGWEAYWAVKEEIEVL